MDRNLLVLIVIVVIVLLVILLTTPACKNAVNGIFKKNAKSVKSKKVSSVTRDKKTRKIANEENRRRAVQNYSHHNKTRELATEDNKRRAVKSFSHHDKPRKHANEALADQGSQEPVNGYKNIGDHQVPAQVPVLSGSVDGLFDAKIDLEEEFGITDAELTRLAKQYKERHLDAPKRSRARTRFMTQVEQERAEALTRKSYLNSRNAHNQRNDYEEFMGNAIKSTIAAQKRAKGEKTKQRRSRSFVTKKR